MKSTKLSKPKAGESAEEFYERSLKKILAALAERDNKIIKLEQMIWRLQGELRNFNNREYDT